MDYNVSMTIARWLIFISWTFFIVYWAISAFGVKKDIKRKNAWFGGGGLIRLTVLFVVAYFVFNHITPFRGLNDLSHALISNIVIQDIAAVLCVGGIAFAIWARVHLGGNWSARPALKEGHELITSGPYRWVRHPIYTGTLLAVLATAFVSAPIWWFFIATFAVVVIVRVQVEERLMLRQFPSQYPEYKKRTKALIPFLW